MEQTDTAKEWFVTHEGKQFGPVSKDDLRFEVERGELNPRLDMVWKNGMADWIPAGELDGIFAKNDEAAATETARDASGNFTGYMPGETDEERDRIKGEWPGVGRGSFFFFCFIFPLLWGFGVGFAMPFLQGKVSPQILTFLPFLLLLVPVILGIAVTLKRFQNLGMTRWWFLGLFVPLLSVWVYYRLFACPPGYAVNKKLDPLGWFLAILYWLLALAVAAAMAAMVYFSTNDPDKLKEWIPEKDFRKFSEMMEKAQQLQSHPAAPESGGEPLTEPRPTE